MLITTVKNAYVKSIHRRSIQTHKMKVTITRRDGNGAKLEEWCSL